MPGLNTTGAPNTRDYTLGRGIVRLAQLTAAGLPDSDGFRDLGNAPEFNISMEVEELPHQSSRQGLKFTDARCTVSQEVQLSFILDEINFQNLSDFFAGSTASYDNPHDTTFDHPDALVTSSLKVGNWYQLKDDNGARVYNLDATGTVYSFEQDPAGTPATLMADDYEIDEAMGLVRFLSGGTTSLSDGDVIGFAITVGASTPQDLDEVSALQREAVEGALLFIQSNACDQGQKTEFLFHKVSLSADGDLSLIGDEFEQMSFTGIAQVNSGVSETSQVMTARTYDQLS